MTGQTDHQVVRTSGGPVELVTREGTDRSLRPILYFHGGHESALGAGASELYTELGHPVVRVSRPGYGGTDVGSLSPASFTTLVDDVREGLRISSFAAVVGTSFGGQQAVEYAGRYPARTSALVLHSAAPSTRPFPDSAAQRRFGPVMFHPRIERYVWLAVGLLLRAAPRAGLRMMMSPLSTQPVQSWLPQTDSVDRQAMRETFATMRSGRGFGIDLSYAGADRAGSRRAAQQRIACPTLITASRRDGAVGWAHAEDFAATIPGARLVEIPAPSHLFWIGPARERLLAALRETLPA